LRLRRKKILSKNDFELKKKFDTELVNVLKKPKKLDNFKDVLIVKKKIESRCLETDSSDKLVELQAKFKDFSDLLKKKYFKSALIKSLGVLSVTNLTKKSTKLAKEIHDISELLFNKNGPPSAASGTKESSSSNSRDNE
jgi:hypothetical protein